MDWFQGLFDTAIALLGGLGGYVIRDLKSSQYRAEAAILDLHKEHLPKKMDKVDFIAFTEALGTKLEALTAEVKSGNVTLSAIERDLRDKVGNLDRRIAHIEGQDMGRRDSNGRNERGHGGT